MPASAQDGYCKPHQTSADEPFIEQRFHLGSEKGEQDQQCCYKNKKSDLEVINQPAERIEEKLNLTPKPAVCRLYSEIIIFLFYLGNDLLFYFTREALWFQEGVAIEAPVIYVTFPKRPLAAMGAFYFANLAHFIQ